MRPRRLVYLGTPEVSVPPLAALLDAGFDVPLVITNPDRRRGRRSAPSPSPVKAAATAAGIRVSHDVADAVTVDADLGVVVAFGRLVPAAILDRLPMVNLHFSTLPRWRGAAPVERAILAGDATTGVDLMVVEEGLDTGAVHGRVQLSIGADETADELRSRLVDAGTELLVSTLRDGLGTPERQRGEPTYAHKITGDDLRIDWDAPVRLIHAQVRVGGAWTTWRGERCKVWRTATPPTGEGIEVVAGDGPIELLEVQPAGKARMPARQWANGARWQPGDRLGT